MARARTVIEPRLTLRQVIVRGALYGVASVIVCAVVAACVPGHEDRVFFLYGTGVVAAVCAVVCLLHGVYFWPDDDVRRLRDWRTVEGTLGTYAVMIPAFLRCGMLALVLAPGAFGLSKLAQVLGGRVYP
ncbi:DUF6336 family protein [Streptomyces albidoflavus]|uniref:DUF6336 family protein n=1 Tax=Streptomyces albidoflavus TaxID=1886 RepID=UPI00352F384A|nr:DUF6336 family protein [Streptomyces albidoflavus]